jgi:hypothetical protein
MLGMMALGMVGGMLAGKVVFRARRRAWMRYRAHGWGQARWREVAPQRAPAAVDAPRRVAEVLGKLELSQRQSEEAEEVFAAIGQALGDQYKRWAEVDMALGSAGGVEFDRQSADASLPLPAAQRRELVDGLEHLHTILTGEQRERLRQEVA